MTLLEKADPEQQQQLNGQEQQPVGRNIRGPEAPSSCSCRRILRILIILGVVLAGLGAIMSFFYRDVFMATVKSQLPLRRDSPTLPMYERPPADAFASFYFFNLTNAFEVTNYGEKPIVQERGPYVYKMVDTKEALDFSTDESEVSFTKRKHYEFDRERSWGDETDVIVTLDFVAYGGFRGAHLKDQTRLGSALLDSMNRGEPFKPYQVRDLLWGAHDSLFKVFLSVVPGETKPPIFGLMFGKNATIDANFTVYTGRDKIDRLQTVRIFNQQDRLKDIWPIVNDANGQEYDPNIFRGTLGQSFAPDVAFDSVLTVFAHDVCFAINFTYRREAFVDDVTTLRFGVDHESHQRLTGMINQALCDQASIDEQTCAMAGLMNVSKCRDGLPIVMSWPHFYESGSANYLYQVDGLAPSEELHGAFIEVDPLTGMTLNGAKRVQINFPLFPLPYEKYKNLPKFTMYPIMWVEEAARISETGLASLKQAVYSKYRLLQFISYATLIVGIGLLATSVLIFFIYSLSCAAQLS